MKDKTLAGVLSEFRSRLARDMDLLAKSQLNLVQAAIAQELLSGRRTVAELTETIHTTRPGDPDYNTQYSKICLSTLSPAPSPHVSGPAYDSCEQPPSVHPDPLKNPGTDTGSGFMPRSPH